MKHEHVMQSIAQTNKIIYTYYFIADYYIDINIINYIQMDLVPVGGNIFRTKIFTQLSKMAGEAWKSQHFRTHKLTKYFEEDDSFGLGYLIIFLTILFMRLCVSVGSYSGMNVPPMYGDYEAQRHWMEITNNLPINEWYMQTENNDLQYWGLDYPPFTAYHSWLCGKIASILNLKQLIELNTSHGIETDDTKFFMRMTVILSDILFFISAVFVFFNIAYPKQEWNAKITAIFCMLINPLFIIIDHGHFQYNCLALGLTLWSINAMFLHHYYISSILFVLSLCFKQMSLFYAFPFFFYLIGISLKNNPTNKLNALFAIFKIGLVVIFTFVVIFYPWINMQSFTDLSQVIHRIFPFERGLFEDKVANIWCCTNILIKWKQIFGVKYTKLLSFAMTLFGCMPCLLLIFKPKPKFFLYCLCISSLTFFLFSYQVHEKNILFPLMPISLFILEAPYFISSLVWIAMFSMLPLLKKDGLLYSYWLLNIIWFTVTFWVQPLHSMQYKKHYSVDDDSPTPPFHPIIGRWRLYKHLTPNKNNKYETYPTNTLHGHAPPFHYAPLFWCYQPFVTILFYFMTDTVQWTATYPDIGTYIIIMYCCAHFSFAWILFVLQFLLEYFDIFSYDDIILCTKINHQKQKKA